MRFINIYLVTRVGQLFILWPCFYKSHLGGMIPSWVSAVKSVIQNIYIEKSVSLTPTPTTPLDRGCVQFCLLLIYFYKVPTNLKCAPAKNATKTCDKCPFIITHLHWNQRNPNLWYIWHFCTVLLVTAGDRSGSICTGYKCMHDLSKGVAESDILTFSVVEWSTLYSLCGASIKQIAFECACDRLCQ